MASKEYVYSVAENSFEVKVGEDFRTWQVVEKRYRPFASSRQPTSSVTLVKGRPEPLDFEPYYSETPQEEGFMGLKVYHLPDGGYRFEMQQPFTQEPNAWLEIDSTLTHATLTIDEADSDKPLWRDEASLTSGMMLYYMLSTVKHDTLMAHASSILYKGKAYLFIAKSGTGKSTHTRLWCENIPEVTLLNDDHPILRADDRGVIAYGSPWSGKTHCYKNLQAPVGGIGRICRDSTNSVERLNPIQSYASLSTSFSGMTFVKALADARHSTLERVIRTVACYNVHCLPNAEAAICSHDVMTVF